MTLRLLLECHRYHNLLLAIILSLSLDVSLFYSSSPIFSDVFIYSRNLRPSHTHVQFYTHVRISRLKIWRVKANIPRPGQFAVTIATNTQRSTITSPLDLHEQFPTFSLSRCESVFPSLRYSSFSLQLCELRETSCSSTLLK